MMALTAPLASVARGSCWTTRHLITRFRRHLGLTIHEWLYNFVAAMAAGASPPVAVTRDEAVSSLGADLRLIRSRKHQAFLHGRVEGACDSRVKERAVLGDQVNDVQLLRHRESASPAIPGDRNAQDPAKLPLVLGGKARGDVGDELASGGDEAPVRARGCGSAPPRPHASGRPLLWICWQKACGSSLKYDAVSGGVSRSLEFCREHAQARRPPLQ